MAVKVSKIGKSAVRIGLNEGSILRNKDGKIRGNTDMFAEEDCIDIPEYKRADGTIVEAHTRCIDRVFTTDETHPEDVKRLSAESNIRSSIMDKLGTPDFDYTKDAYDLLKNINSELGVDPDFTYKPAIDMALSGLDETRPIKSLSDLENAFIKAYTDEDTYYVNLGLREGDELTVSDKVYAMGLQSALAKAPKVGKTRLYRDVQNLDEIAGVDNFNSAINLYEQNIGGVINFDAFTSTTRRTGNFTLRPSMSIKYIIDTSENSKGVDVSGLSKHDDESEVLFPMDSKFEITKVEKDYKGFIAAVYLKEI